jgi:hypothetical protein
MIFLERHFIIRSFTCGSHALQSAQRPGPSTNHVVSRVNYDDLRQDVSQVLLTREPLERRVMRNDTATHYIIHVLPYREPDSAVSGMLIGFVDVTSIVHAAASLVQTDVCKGIFLCNFLARAATPTRTAAHLLQSKQLSGKQRSSAQAIITRQVGHMSALLGRFARCVGNDRRRFHAEE